MEIADKKISEKKNLDIELENLDKRLDKLEDLQKILKNDQERIKKIGGVADKDGEIKKIENRYAEFRRIVLLLMFAYVTTYILWVILAHFLCGLTSGGSGKKSFWWALVVTIASGLLYCSDAVITTMLKSPFGILCFDINKSSLSEEQKTSLTNKVTNINENLRSTIGKFGLMTVVADLLRVIILGKSILDSAAYGEYVWMFTYLSLLFPLGYAIFTMWRISIEFKNLKKKEDSKEVKVKKNVSVLTSC